MRNIGISVYPNGSNTEHILNYFKDAAALGFTRVFTCLISMDSDMNKTLEIISPITKAANELGLEIVADVSPDVLNHLGANFHNLKPLKELGLWGIRLDLGYSGLEESFMTFNPYGLKVELNMSNGTRTPETILSYQANTNNLLGCHNFYPHTYTGLSRKHFIGCSKQFRDMRIPTAAFVSSNEADHGPWPVSEGLCTLEEHRNLSIATQARDLFNTGLIDTVIIGNAFASHQELKELAAIDRYILEIPVAIHPDANDLNRKILLEEFHFNRGDVSEYMIRSTQSRVKYKSETFPAFNTPDIDAGDILIESSLYPRYAGELQIALKPMKNSGRTNVVAKIDDEALFLLNHIEPWQKFKFVETQL